MPCGDAQHRFHDVHHIRKYNTNAMLCEQFALSFTYTCLLICYQVPTFDPFTQLDFFVVSIPNYFNSTAHMDSHPYCISTSPGILVAMVDTTVGVGSAKDQPLMHTFVLSPEQVKSPPESESLYLSTARSRSPSTISSSSGSSSGSSAGSSSLSDKEVQQHNRAAAFYVNVDQAYLCIQRAYLNVQRAHNARKVI